MTEQQTLAGVPATSGQFSPGAFVWHEYFARDLAGARTFYSELFGWEVKGMPMAGGPEYPEIFVGEKAIGGFYACDPNDEATRHVPAHWFGYVSVPDVDRASADVTAAGGRVVAGPMAIPHVGRVATAMDPQGAVFALFRSEHGDPNDEMPGLHEFCWDSLSTTDVDAAKTFYPRVVGWGIGDSEAGGVFTMGEAMEASFDPAQPGVPAHWLAHIVVTNLEEMRAKLEKLGGQVLAPEVAIPFGRFAIVRDPFGAAFSLFEAKPF